MIAGNPGQSESPPPGHSVTGTGHLALLLIFEGGLFLVQLATFAWIVAHGNEPGTLSILAGGFVGSNLLLMLGIAVIINMARKNELENIKLISKNGDLNRAISSSAKLNASISEDRMQIAYAHTKFCAELFQAFSDDQFADIDAQFKSYLTKVLDLTASLFSTYTGIRCSACIKIFEGGEGDSANAITDHTARVNVLTLLRDSLSSGIRSKIDTKLWKFDYHNNTAFYNIYYASKEPEYYVSDNLVQKAADGIYRSDRDDWSIYYNSVAVVPIRPYGDHVQEHCAGFLCVDNIGGGFDCDRCVNILNGIASDLYFGIFSAISHMKKLKDVKARKD